VAHWPKDMYPHGNTEERNSSGRRNRDDQILARLLPAPPPTDGAQKTTLGPADKKEPSLNDPQPNEVKPNGPRARDPQQPAAQPGR
jgi:hypothetical protein